MHVDADSVSPSPSDTSTTAGAADEATVFDHDLYCANCGYNLRGLVTTTHCPECGLAAKVSLRQDWIADGPRAWRRRLLWGARLFLVGTVLALPALYAGLLVAVAGLWLLMAPQPGREEPATDRHHRLGGRGMLLLGVVGLVGIGVAIATAEPSVWGAVGGNFRGIFRGNFRGNFRGWRVYDGAFIAAHAVLVLGLLATWDYLHILARRVPSPPLARRCRRLRWCWIAGVAGFALVGLAAGAVDWSGLRHQVSGLGLQWLTIAGFGLVAVILLWLWLETLRLAVRVWRVLRGVRV